MPAIDALLSLKIPVMLLKGGARIAADWRAASSRYLRDFDVLVPRSEMAAAIDALRVEGFRPLTGLLPGSVRATAFVAGPGAVEGPVRAEIDLHWSALRFGRIADHDERLISRGKSPSLLGRSVLVPSAADQLVIALAHGVVADSERPCDWVVDAIQSLRDASLDWAVVADEARARRLEIPVASGLAFLGDELGLDVPRSIRAELEGALRSHLFTGEFLSEITERDKRGPIKRLYSIAAEQLRSRGLRRTPPPAVPMVSVVPQLMPLQRRCRTPVVVGVPVPLSARSQKTLPPLYFDMRNFAERCDFDLYLDELWTARIKIRRRAWMGFFGGIFLVRVRLPNRWRGGPAKTLQLVALDAQHMRRDVGCIKVYMLGEIE